MKMKQSESKSCSVMSDSLRPHGPQSIEFSRPEYWSGYPFPPTQGLNPGLQHCRWILYQLSHRGSPDEASMEEVTVEKRKTTDSG